MAFTLTNPFNVTDAGALALDGAWRATTAVVGGTTYLFVTGSLDDGVSVFSVAANGALTNVFNVTDAGALQLDDAEGVATAVVGGTTYLFATGFQDNGVSVFSVAANGALTSVFDVTDAGAFELDGAREVTTAVVGGTTYLFVTGANDDGVSVFSVAANGALTNVFNVTDDLALNLDQAEGVTTAVVGGTTYLFVAGVADDGVTVFSVAANGALTFASNVNDNVTLELDGAQDVTTAVVGGTTYLFVTGRVDDGVSVFSVAANGALTNVFNVTDDATLELDSSMGMTTATFGGTTYLFVTGFDDDGMSVFSVAANGTLTNVANSTDDATLELDGALGVTSAAVDGHTHVFVAGQVDDGVSVFSVPDLDVTQATVLHTDNDVGGPDGVIDPGDVVRTTVTITNNNTTTDATGVSFAETLVGMTLFDQAGALDNINVSPLAFDDSYNVIGNTTFSVSAAQGVLVNDVEFFGATIGTNTATQTHIVTTGVIDTAGGTVTLNADGSFTYTGDAGFTGTDSFTYTLIDLGLNGVVGGGDDLTGTGTVSFVVEDSVWFIDNTAGGVGGSGTQSDPFRTIDDFNDVNDGVGTHPAAGDFIYLREGTGTYTEADGINLLNNQTLIGQGENLVINHSVGGNITVETGSAGDTPLIVVTGAGNQGIQLASGNTISGLDVGMNNALAVGIADGGGTVGALTISNVGVGVGSSLGRAIDIDQGGTLNVQLDSVTSSGSATNGIDLGSITGLAGTGNHFTVSGLTTIDDSVGDAIEITNSSLNATFTGKVNILNDAAGANGDGVVLSTNTGTYSFNGGVDIEVSGASAFGFRAQSSGTVNILDPGGNTNEIISNNGTAILINPTTFNAALDQVTSSGGTEGISLNGMSGTLTIGSVDIDGQSGDGIDITNSAGSVTINGGTIGATNDPGGIGVDINGGSGNVTINASITKTTDGRAIEVTNHTGTGGGGSTISFGSTVSSTGASDGIFLDTNGATNGTTISFTNTLTIDTSASDTTGFTATGGGTVTATGSGSTVNSDDGTAINVQNTNIGAADLTFQKVDANGGSATGIILNTTGSAGGLHITGTGTAGSGGTIANKTGSDGATATGVGIYLNNTADVQLDRMQLNDFQNFAIEGHDVNGFSLTNSVISGVNGNNSAFDEGSMFFTNSSGTLTFSNIDVSGGLDNNLRVVYDSATPDTAVYNVTGSTFRDLQTLVNDSLVELTSTTTASASSNVTFNFGSTSNPALGNTFENTANTLPPGGTENWADGILVTFEGGFQHTLNIDNNTFHHLFQAMDMASNFSADVDYRVYSNDITFTEGVAAIAFGSGSSSTAASLIQALIEDNNIGTVAGGNDSGSRLGEGIVGDFRGAETARVTIHQNVILNTEVNGIRIISQATTGDGDTHVRITNNTVDSIDDDEGGGAGVIYGIEVTTNAATNGDIFADIRGNDSDNVNAFDIRVRQATLNNTFALEDFAGDGTNAATVEAFLAAQNPASTTNVRVGGSVVSYTSQNLNNTNTPAPFTPLLAAPGGVDAAAPADTTPSADTTPPADSTPPADTTPPQDTASGPGDQTPATPTPPAVAAHPVIVDDGTLSQSELDYFVDAALARWTASGLTDAQVAAINALTFSVGEMDGLTLGSFAPGLITFDSDAAGSGWFLDGTPLDDAEFGNVLSDTRMWTDPTGAAAGHFDLLTTVMHEMGHALGLGDSYAAADREDLMYGWLFTGERRLAAAGEADGAIAGSITSEEFLASAVPIGLLPFGKTVTIQWDATINAQSNQLIVDPVNTGTVTANAPFPASTNSNTVTTTLDTLILGGTIWNDNGAGGGGIAGNGIKDGTEPGVDGVLLSLFVDANNNDVPDSPGSPIASTTTAGGGVYSFTGLAPGNYIVRIDADNFINSGGADPFTALVGLQISPVTAPDYPDPDDNVDSDDNGNVHATGTDSFSKAITLAYNTEPTAGTGNDTNTTLDLGFLNNPPPDLTNLAGTVTFTEDGPAILLDTGTAATVTDDQTNLNGGSLTASTTVNEAAGEDVLGISTAGTVTLSSGTSIGSIVSVGGQAIGTVTANGTGGNDLVVTFNTTDATQARVSLLVQALTYFNSNTGNPSTLARTVAVTVNDGLGGTDFENVTVNITAVNDAPVLTTSAGITAFVEGDNVASTPVAIDPTLTVADIDTTTFTSVKVWISSNFQSGQDLLAYAGAFGDIVSGGMAGNTLTLTSAGASTQTDWQNALRAVTYTNSSETPNTATRAISFFANDGSVNSYQTHTQYAAQVDPQDIATADLNHDSILDLVVANYGEQVAGVGGNSISVYIGNGDGTFDPQVTYATGINPAAIALVDLNNDTHLDVITPNYQSNNISVRLGTGTGTFGAQTTIATGVRPFAITSGFFNNDLFVDLATANRDSASVSILLGNGSGGFSPHNTISVGTAGSSVTTSIVAGDLNNDTFIDLVALNELDHQLKVLFGDGTGAFTVSGTPLSTGNTPFDVAIADLDGDLDLDLAVTNIISADVTVLLNNGAGIFSGPVSYSVSSPGGGFVSPTSVIAADFNGDGKVDLLTSNGGRTNVAVLLGNGDGTFQTRMLFDFKTAPFDVAAGDFDGNGQVDLATANVTPDNVSVLLFGNKDVSVQSVNDTALITGDASGTVQEAGGAANGTPGVPSDTGNLDSTDLDNPADSWTVVSTPAASIGGYGTYTVTAAGVWTYTVDDNNATVQALNGVGTLNDTFNATTVDGTAQLVTITINAQNDSATITGDASGDVTEAGGIANGTPGTPTDTGDLNAADVDDTPDAWNVVANGTGTIGGYGTYGLTAAGVWTYTLDDNNAAVQALNGAATLTDTFNAVTADGTTQLVSVTINAQNDAPALANVDANAAYTENAAAIPLDTVPLIVPSDFDNSTMSSATVAITSGFVLGDVLEFLDVVIPASAGANYNAATGVLTINAVDNLPNYQQVLRSITFSSTSDNPGASRTITWTITDNAGVPLAGTSQTTTIAVQQVNDTPVNNVPVSIAVTEDVATALTGIVFDDPDAGGGTVTATFAVPSGSVNAVSGGGVTAGGSSSSRTLTGTIANINAFIAGSNLTFTTALNATANVNLTVTLNDGGNTGTDPGLTGNGTSEEDTDIVTLAVTAVNDQPILADVGLSAPFIENGAAALLDSDSDAAITDVELDALNGGLGNYDGAVLTLQRNGGPNEDDVFGGTGSLDLIDSNGLGENVSLDGGGTFIGTHTNAGGIFQVTFNSNATSADVDSVLQQIIYSNAGDNPPSSATIDYTFSDGNAGSQGSGATPGLASATTSVAITQINDAPFLLNVAPSASYVLGSPGSVLSPGLQAGDLDATPPSPNVGMASATVKIATGFFAGDELFVNLTTSGGFFVVDEGDNNTGPMLVTTNISVQSNILGTLVLSGTDSPLHYQLVLDAVSYHSTAPDPSNGGANPQRTITWKVSDGLADNTSVNPPPLPETILSFNAPPTVDLDASGGGTGFTTTYTERDAPIPIADTDLLITDPDNAALSRATIVLTNAKAGDVMSIAGALLGGIDSSIDTSVPGQITINLTNSASLADYQAAIGLVRFKNSSAIPDITDRDITVTAVDGSNGTSNVAHATVHVVDLPNMTSDFNADGLGDILWQNIDGTPAVWLLDGVNLLVAGPALPNPNPGAPPPSNQSGQSGAPAPWREIGSSDFNGDGKADILWQNVDGTPAVWLMDGVDLLSAGPALSNPGPSWHAKEAADFNGDGKADILWQNDSGAAAIWLMDGVNLLQPGPALPNPGPTWHTKAAADFNGDGKADILWQNDSGAAAIWLMDGVNLGVAGPALPNPGPSWNALAAADFNGDGNADILWQNADGTPAVWLMDGVNLLAAGPALSNPGPSWHAKEAIDANGDGMADILWQNENGTPAVWLMDSVNLLSAGPQLSNPGASWHII